MTIDQAMQAIERLERRRMGIDRFDYWVDYAQRQWRLYIDELNNTNGEGAGKIIAQSVGWQKSKA